MHPRTGKLVMASIVVAVIAGAAFLLIPWQEASIDRPLAGLAWVFANGTKFMAMGIFLIAIAIAAGTYVDAWING